MGRAPCGGAGLRPARPARVQWSTNQVNANPKNQDELTPHHMAALYGQFRMCPAILSN